MVLLFKARILLQAVFIFILAGNCWAKELYAWFLRLYQHLQILWDDLSGSVGWNSLCTAPKIHTRILSGFASDHFSSGPMAKCESENKESFWINFPAKWKLNEIEFNLHTPTFCNGNQRAESKDDWETYFRSAALTWANW